MAEPVERWRRWSTTMFLSFVCYYMEYSMKYNLLKNHNCFKFFIFGMEYLRTSVQFLPLNSLISQDLFVQNKKKQLIFINSKISS